MTSITSYVPTVQARKFSGLAFHVACVSLLLFLFGGGIYSLSVDLALHYSVVDALMKFHASSLPYLDTMAGYPTFGYWPPALLGYLTGSGLTAMWLLSIAAIYASYYFAASLLLSADRNILGLATFVVLLVISLPVHAIVGFEIVIGFFYAQLIATVLYFAALYFMASRQKSGDLITIIGVIALAAVALTTHAVPSLAILAACGTSLLYEIIVKAIRNRKLDRANVIWLCIFTVSGVSMVLAHPAFWFFRSIASHNGSIDVRIGPAIVVLIGVAGTLLAGYRLWFTGEREPGYRAGLMIFSAVTSSTGLMVLQWMALSFLGQGAPYAVMKWTYLVVTSSALAVGYGMQHLTKTKMIAPKFVAPLISVVICCAVLFREPINLGPIVHQLNYAETALKSHPDFRPGNTASIASGVYNTIRYMISTTTFQMRGEILPAVGLLNQTFNPKTSVEYVMVSKQDALKEPCSERFAETNEFLIVPVRCLK